MNGSTFLLLYIAMLTVALMVSIAATRGAIPEGRIDPSPTSDTLAWLAGGKARLVDALISRTLAAGDLRLAGGRFVDPQGLETSWSTLSRHYGTQAAAVEQRLRRAGLLLDPETLQALRRRAALPFAIVGAIGIARLCYGIAVERPVGFLVLLLVLTGALALIRIAAIGRQTLGGRETLARARAANDRLRRAPRASEMDMGVALFGTAVLAGSAYAPYHQLRSNGDGGASTSSDGGDSGGDGGGSGCGGGCGGCGS